MLDPESKYGAHWPERRNAGLDRGHAKDDRTASHDDRIALTEGDVETQHRRDATPLTSESLNGGARCRVGRPRESVMSAPRQLERAYLDAHPAQVHRHAARLLDLLDRARANGIDTSGWVPPTLMAVVMTSAADTV